MKTLLSFLPALLLLCCAPLAAQSISSTPVAGMPATSGDVSAIVEYNGMVIIGGSFGAVGGQARGKLAAINATTGSVINWNPGVTGSINAMVVSGDYLYIAGPFTAVGGQTRYQLASFFLPSMGTSNGGLTNWAPVVSNTITPFFFGDDVECLALMNNRLYVGGFFGRVNGSARGGACSFDLTNTAANPSLTSWDPNTWTSSGAGFEIWGVFNMFAHAGTNSIVMTGPFEGVGGTHIDDGTASPHTLTMRSSIAAINGTTGACLAWDPDCGSTTWSDDAMASNGSVVYLGGLGYSVKGGGTTVSRSNTCGLNVTANTATTNPATGFNPQLNERPWAIGVHPSGSPVVMGGQWTAVGGTAYGKLLSFNAATGAVDTSWQPNPSTYPTTIRVSATRVYVGGSFTTIAGQSRQGFAAFDIVNTPTITTSSPLPTGTSGTAYSHQFAASGGTPGYTWGATGLPGGWSMSTSGLLTANTPAPGTINFNVTVTDAASQQASAAFAVTITAPALTITTAATLPQGTQGVTYSAQLNASGGYGSYSWSVNSGSSLPSGWSIGAGTGLISAAAGSVQPGTFNFTVRVTDAQPVFVTKAFSVTVASSTPTLNISNGGALPAGTHGQTYSYQFTATGGCGGYNWSFATGSSAPAGLALNASTGVLSGTAQGGSYSFSVKVTSGTQTATKANTLAVNFPALSITTGATLPQGTQNVTYSAQLNASGGNGSYAWSVATGSSLPSGWSIGSSTGLISASAGNVQPGTFNFTLQCVSGAQNITKAFSVTVIAATPTLQITSNSALPGGTHMVAYSFQFAATGGSGSYNWSVVGGSLPGGTALNASTGVLSGTPNGGSYSFTVQVAAGTQTDSKGFTLSVVFPALSITTGSTLPAGTQNVGYAAQLNAAGGTGSYAWNVAAGSSLPAGWTLSSASGLISAGSGFVQPGTYGFTIQVASGSQVASKAFTLTIQQAVTPVQINSSATLPAGATGIAYSFQFTATGGQGSYSWSVQTGSTLPAGWNLAAATGVLSATGASVNPGAYSFGIAVTDGTSTDAGNFSVTVTGAAIGITTGSLPSGEEGTPYGATLQAAGGSGIGYDWTLVAGNLPAGLTGIPGVGQAIGLSGTPLAAGSETFTVRVTDNVGAFAEQTFTLTIDQPGTGGNNGGGNPPGGGGGCAVGVPVSATQILAMLGMVALAVFITVRLRRRS